jgi:voltage-gated potassium channel
MMEQVHVGSGAASRTLGSLLFSSGVNVIVLALRGSDGRMIFNPPIDTRIAAGDFLIVLGDKQSLNELESALTDS